MDVGGAVTRCDRAHLGHGSRAYRTSGCTAAQDIGSGMPAFASSVCSSPTIRWGVRGSGSGSLQPIPARS